MIPKRPSSRRRGARAVGRQKANMDLTRPLAQGDTFLPHERDEAPGVVDGEAVQDTPSREVIRQAEHDVTHGLQDTERRGVPSNVPGPGSVLGSSSDERSSPPDHEPSVPPGRRDRSGGEGR